jgi:hypothetical protein
MISWAKLTSPIAYHRFEHIPTSIGGVFYSILFRLSASIIREPGSVVGTGRALGPTLPNFNALVFRSSHGRDEMGQLMLAHICIAIRPEIFPTNILGEDARRHLFHSSSVSH